MLAGGLLLGAVASALTGAPVHDDAPWIQAGPTGRVALHDGWTVAEDRGDRGLTAGFASGRFSGRHVDVPYVPNAGQLTGAAGLRSFQGSVAWYRRLLVVPRGGRYALRFESVNHHATVWVDGRRVGDHVGTYLPFEVGVRLTAGRPHVLVVRADWRDPRAMKRAGWHRTWFNFGGVNREVTLRPLGGADLAGPTLHTRLRGGRALVDVTVRVTNATAATRPIPVTGTLAHGAQRVGFRLAGPPVPAGATRVLRATVPVEGPALWAPGTPNLYALALRAGHGEAGYRARVGLRELTWRDGALRLNGRALTLRGASIQEDAPGRGDGLHPADQDALVRQLVGLGANATRCQHPLDPGVLERLDAAGILVWQGVGPIDGPGAWSSNTPAKELQARTRVRTSVSQLGLHPSIVAWNLVNELAANGHDAGQVAYVRDMARELHAGDPGRLVSVDVWGTHLPRTLGAVYGPVDAVGVTNYEGWYADTYLSSAQLAGALTATVDRLHRTFPGKVLLISEFGAEANAANPTNRPGGYAFQARLLAAHLQAYRASPWLAGELVWNLRDFGVAPSFAGGSIRRVAPDVQLVRGLNQKGLETYGGQPKLGYTAVSRALHDMDRAARARGGL